MEFTQQAKIDDHKLALKYWNGRGLMEVPRTLLAIAGKFPPNDYEDGRYSAPPDNLEANLGRMPLVEIDGTSSIGQSGAINFYVASLCGLMGDSVLEAAQILNISEHIKEMRTAYSKLVSFGSEASPEVIKKWFEEGATDVTGPADRAGYESRYLTWWMGRIENSLPGTAGFAVGSRLSLADVLMYNAFGETLVGDQIPEGGLKNSQLEPFADKARTDAMLAKHPKIKASVDAVASNGNVQKWLKQRGVQRF